MLYFSPSHFVYIISEGWKQFSRVGEVSLDKVKNSAEKLFGTVTSRELNVVGKS